MPLHRYDWDKDPRSDEEKYAALDELIIVYPVQRYEAAVALLHALEEPLTIDSFILIIQSCLVCWQHVAEDTKDFNQLLSQAYASVNLAQEKGLSEECTASLRLQIDAVADGSTQGCWDDRLFDPSLIRSLIDNYHLADDPLWWNKFSEPSSTHPATKQEFSRVRENQGSGIVDLYVFRSYDCRNSTVHIHASCHGAEKGRTKYRRYIEDFGVQTVRWTQVCYLCYERKIKEDKKARL